MRISELKEKKITRRATRDFDADGNRIYDFFEYNLPYTNRFPNIDKQREVAKVIDLVIFFLIFLFCLNRIRRSHSCIRYPVLSLSAALPKPSGEIRRAKNCSA